MDIKFVLSDTSTRQNTNGKPAEQKTRMPPSHYWKWLVSQNSSNFSLLSEANTGCQSYIEVDPRSKYEIYDH